MTSPLDDLIAAEREAPPEAPALQSKRTWKRLQKSLAVGAAAPFDLPPPGAGATSATVHATAAGATGTKAAVMSTAAKVFLATVIGGTATLTTVAALTNKDPQPTKPPPVATAAVPVPVPVNVPEATHEPKPELPPSPKPDLVPDLVPEPPEAEPEADPELVIEDTPPEPKRATKPKPAAPPQTSLAAELEVVGRASRAVNAGRYNEALTVLRKHAKQFADGALLEDRLALKAIALCGAGKLDSGNRAATRFAKSYPRSVHAARVREACERDSKTK